MAQNIWIGRANRLGNVGELVSVTIGGKVIKAKVARSFASLNVLVVRSGDGQYYAYPDKVEYQRAVNHREIAKHDKQKTPTTETIDTVLIYRVRVNTLAPCTRSYWSFGGDTCVESCASGTYTSRQTCISNLPPIPPPTENDFNSTPIYNVGYFKPGFLSALGAPEHELGFFYPIGFAQDRNVLCRMGGQIPTGFSQNEGRDVIQGNGRYANRKWLLPRHIGNSYDVFMAVTDSRSVSHLYYPDTRITSGVLQQWNNLYRLNFYSDGTGILLGGNPSEPINIGNNPWETSLQKLNADGSPVEFGEGTQFGDYADAFKWIGYPNWMWRQVDINAIAIFDTIYFSGNQSFFYQDTFTILANLNRQALSTDTSFTYTNIVHPSSVLPPASIISCDYFGSVDGSIVRPSPPGSGWRLLWDTGTCPPEDHGNDDDGSDPELNLISYQYYLVVNGQEPIHLIDFREDDPHSIFLTNLGDNRYRCGIRSGAIPIDIGGGDTATHYYKLRIFSSDLEDVEEYTYPNIPEPFSEDWQDIFYQEWHEPEFSTEDICLLDFGSYGTMNIQPIEGVVTGLTPEPLDPLLPPVNVLDDILGGDVQWSINVSNYGPGVNDQNQPICQVTPLKENILVSIPRIGEEYSIDDVDLYTIKFFYKGKL